MKKIGGKTNYKRKKIKWVAKLEFVRAKCPPGRCPAGFQAVGCSRPAAGRGDQGMKQVNKEMLVLGSKSKNNKAKA